MIRASERGLTTADFNDFTVGMILDYITTYNNLHTESDSDIEEATQSDYDNF